VRTGRCGAIVRECGAAIYQTARACALAGNAIPASMRAMARELLRNIDKVAPINVAE